jgi:hypothetical protein
MIKIYEKNRVGISNIDRFVYDLMIKPRIHGTGKVSVITGETKCCKQILILIYST